MEKRLENIAGWIVFLLVASAFTAEKVYTMKTKADFKKALLKRAKKIESQTGIPSDFTIGQAGLESAWGQSQLTREAFNLFGMTVGQAWKDAYTKRADWSAVPVWTILLAKDGLPAGRNAVFMPTTENSKLPPEKITYWELPGDIMSKAPDGNGGTVLKVRRPFRAYASFDESLDDWAKKIASTPRYKKAYNAALANDARAWGLELKNAGYGTNPKYAEIVLSFVQAAQGIPEVTV